MFSILRTTSRCLNIRKVQFLAKGWAGPVHVFRGPRTRISRAPYTYFAGPVHVFRIFCNFLGRLYWKFFLTASNSKVVCEHVQARARIGCTGGKKIEILYGNYGRTDSETCSGGLTASEVENSVCEDPTSLDKLKAKCNGIASCNLFASNTVFGDPCPGTVKFLEVRYVCRQRK
jgi:hypothetical protein